MSKKNVIDMVNAAGERLGDSYRIISKLAEGGMGVAYRAWDEQKGRPVVIKFPKKSFLEDPGFGERFLREIRLLQGLSHPHIVPIIDVGQHYNTIRPHSALGYRPPAPEAWQPRAFASASPSKRMGLVYWKAKP